MEKIPPIPQPRRQNYTTTLDTQKLAYENVSIDIINKNIDIKDDNLQSHNNNKHEKLQNNKVFITTSTTASCITTTPATTTTVCDDLKNVITEMNNLNMDKNKVSAHKNFCETNKITNLIGAADTPRPIPAPRRIANCHKQQRHQQQKPEICEQEIYSVPDDENTRQPIEQVSLASEEIKLSNNMLAANQVSPKRAPEIPKSIISRQRSDSDGSTLSFEQEFIQSSDLKKSISNSSISSSNSSHSNTSQASKYTTTSPGKLLKSLSATSKLLSESISERVTVKTKDAKHKIDKIQKSSRNKFTETTRTASLRLKEVRKSIHKLSDNLTTLAGRNGGSCGDGISERKSMEYNLERPQTVPSNDQIFQSISFNSPLNSKSNNCENLSMAESSYEIPKKTRSFSSDLSVEQYTLKRGSLDRSDICLPTDELYVRVDLSDGAKKIDKSNIDINSSISFKTIESSASDMSSSENIPCPNYPAPINTDGVYGKLNQSNIYSSSTESESPAVRPPVRHKRKKDYEITQIRPKVGTSLSSSAFSNRATCDSNEFSNCTDDRPAKIFSRDVARPSDVSDSVIIDSHELNSTSNSSRSESWNFYDVNNGEGDDDRCNNNNSSPEPIYANDVVAPQVPISASSADEPVYGLLCDMESPNGTLLVPQNIQRKRCNKNASINNSYTALSSYSILKEFDPLVVTTVDQIFSNKSNELILLENLLGEETYGHIIADDNTSTISDDEDSVESNSATSFTIPPPPERQDSLQVKLPTSVSMQQQSPVQFKKAIIIHQNMNLRSDSMENILAEEDAAVAPYLARNDEESTGHLAVNCAMPSHSQWFVTDNGTTSNSDTIQSEKFHKDQSINPVNSKQDNKPVDKVIKNIIKRPKDDKPLYDPPSYNEAIGGEISDMNKPSGGKSTSMKSMFSNVLTKMEGLNLNIKRKSSFKNTAITANNNTTKSDVQILIEMIPKPIYTPNHILHDGHLVRLPSGVVDDILKEQQLRRVYLRDRKFQAYFEKDPKTPKENIPLDYITTVQCVSNHKFSNNSIEMHCFEITTAIPKNLTNLSNPNAVITASNSGNTKSQRICHLYGVPKESERFIWMQKLIESLTDVFPAAFTCKYYRAGWCYLKNSISSQWSGAWILLQKQKRKLLFYSYGDMNLECMDLRKARCLVLKDNDDSIKNLHVESGPILMIDCPPFSMYLIMCSPRETKIWRHIIREVAHNNGPSLKEQQLTKDNVPVLVDKCINFIYAQGSMSEGIYRKSGSENSIQKLLTLFRTDAFNVQITRAEYNEHDVANALKRFMRDLPDRFLGKYSASFISVSEMKTKAEKITAYKELLARLPSIEYHTLRKLIGHLNFIQSQKVRNKMGMDNLGIIWGPTLLQDKQSELQYSQKEANVIIDLISLYKNLYQLTTDEVAKEQIMLTVLKKYHAAAENLSDTVKKSGDLKVWITIDPNPENETEEKQQINVTLTPTKTAYDICKELATKMKREPFMLTLNEIILNGDLHRPLHYSEKVFDIVLRWSYWPETDRKDNYLLVRPMKFLREIQRALRNLPVVSPNKELKFADQKTKSFKSFTLELSDDRIVVMKKEKNAICKIKEIEMRKWTAYIGCEKKRDFSSRWAITLIESDLNKNILRTRDSPFIGHVIAGTNSNDSIVWYSSIWHSLYGDNIMPNPEIVLS